MHTSSIDRVESNEQFFTRKALKATSRKQYIFWQIKSCRLKYLEMSFS